MYNSSSIRLYTPKGKEFHIVRPGQTVPAGWMRDDFSVVDKEMVSVYSIIPGNPYDQGARDKKILTLVYKKS